MSSRFRMKGALQRDTALWLGALLLALAFLATDSALRLRTVHRLAQASLRPPAAAAATSADPAVHQLILHGSDSYHWIMQAEDMLDSGALRLRQTHRDNAPHGRAVHWSGAMRWWLTGVAAVYRQFHPERSLRQSLQHVAPWANAALLALLLCAVTPFVALRFGAVPAALLALGSSAIHPFYQFFVVGDFDHHGLAAFSSLAAVLFLVAGGAGWVRSGADTGRRPATDSTFPPPAPHRARRWFVASAVAGGIGLWVSAASTIPVLVGIGLAALLVPLVDRVAPRSASAVIEPTLWRHWGLAGCSTSIAFYLLEYFPAHMGMRLEVNHPLYAFAWLGAGDLLARYSQLFHERRRREWLRFVPGTVLLLAPVLVIALTGHHTFQLANRGLLALHNEYISEFRDVFTQFALHGPWQVLQADSAAPLLALPLIAMLWPTTTNSPFASARRVVLIGIATPALLYLHAISFALFHRALGDAAAGPAHVAALFLDAAAIALLLLWPLRAARPGLDAATQGALLLALLPASVTLVLALGQVRWLGNTMALWLVVLISAAAVWRAGGSPRGRVRPLRVIAALLLALILLPLPLFTAAVHWRLGYPGTANDLNQLVARDVSHALRAELGERRGLVLTDATATSWMLYFGGLHGVGTLYWENLPGLEAAAALYHAPDDEHARRLFRQRGITHLVIYSWRPDGAELTRLTDTPAARPGFVSRLLISDAPPPWLRLLPYRLPRSPVLQDRDVLIYEVLPDPAAGR